MKNCMDVWLHFNWKNILSPEINIEASLINQQFNSCIKIFFSVKVAPGNATNEL